MTTATSEPSTRTFPRTQLPNPLKVSSILPPPAFESIPGSHLTADAFATLHGLPRASAPVRTVVHPMNPSDPHKRVRLEDACLNQD